MSLNFDIAICDIKKRRPKVYALRFYRTWRFDVIQCFENIQIMRVYVTIREVLLTNKDVLLKLEQLDKQVGQHNAEIQLIF